MDIINIVLAGFALAGFLAVMASYFLVVKNKTTVKTLTESNTAYSERNAQLENENHRLKEKLDKTMRNHAAQISELRGRISALEKIKTPPLEPLITMIVNNHSEVMSAIAKVGIK